jgi:hypothetical protein
MLLLDKNGEFSTMIAGFGVVLHFGFFAGSVCNPDSVSTPIYQGVRLINGR